MSRLDKAAFFGQVERMLLAVDIGNTQTVFGVYQGNALIRSFRVDSSRGRTSDEFLSLLLSLTSFANIERDAVKSAIIASVVPALTDPISRAIQLAFDRVPLVVGPGIKTGMPILYENPKEVGADRIVNAVAAFEQTQCAVIVVDLGTATTFDVVTDKGEYQGGVIAPGIQISADALFTRAAKLARVPIERPAKVIGRTTMGSTQSGIIFGYVSLVDGLVDRIEAEYGGPMKVIATGGLAPLIARESRRIERVEPDLTLEGLRLLFERNREVSS